MAMELHVFFRGELPTKSALNATMKALGLPLAIKPARGSLAGHEGYLPMRWRREETGVEFDVYSDPAALNEIRPEGVDPKLDRSANFRWGGDESELLAAQCLAAAITKLTNGIVFDPEGDRIQSLDELLGEVRGTLAAEKPPPTSITHLDDLKLHLKALLELRSDLMLCGDLLLIRPVRHVLRGVRFEAGGPNSFGLYRYVRPIYENPNFLGFQPNLHWPIFEVPHLQAMMQRLLRVSAFIPVGKATSLLRYTDWLRGGPEPGQRLDDYLMQHLVAYVLAGERERAESLFEQMHPRADSWFIPALVFLGRGVASICAEYHEKEEATAKALNLGDAWQPSPFPVEVPANERETRTNEPPFIDEPWTGTEDD
jgi:hypothetical protein